MKRKTTPTVLELYPELFPDHSTSIKKEPKLGSYPTFKQYDTFPEMIKHKWMKLKPKLHPHVIKVRTIVAYKIWTDKIRRFVMNDPMPDWPGTPGTPATPKYMWFDLVNMRPVYVR